MSTRSRLAFAIQFPSFPFLLWRSVQGLTSILDVGSGRGDPLRRFRLDAELVGLDLFLSDLRIGRRTGCYAETILGDARRLPFRAKSFDGVSALDVLEHLPKPAGYTLLADLERIARRRIVLLTPNGFDPTHAPVDNPYQRHRSGWTTDELRALGFTVYGVHGFRGLRGEGARIRGRPPRFWNVISGFTQKLTYFSSRHAFHLLGIKHCAPT